MTRVNTAPAFSWNLQQARVCEVTIKCHYSTAASPLRTSTVCVCQRPRRALTATVTPGTPRLTSRRLRNDAPPTKRGFPHSYRSDSGPWSRVESVKSKGGVQQCRSNAGRVSATSAGPETNAPQRAAATRIANNAAATRRRQGPTVLNSAAATRRRQGATVNGTEATRRRLESTATVLNGTAATRWWRQRATVRARCSEKGDAPPIGR